MSITLFGVAATLGFISAGYLLWRNAVEENLAEDHVFDIFLASAIWALLAARAAAVVLQFDRFGWDLFRWLSFFHLPGMNGYAALLVGVMMIAVGARRRNWNVWLSLDVFAPPVLLWQIFLTVIFFWKLSLFWLVWLVFLVICQQKYRLWDWYRGRRGEARPGLVFSLWLIAVAGGFFLLALSGNSVLFSGIIGFALMVAGGVSAFRRSGRVWRSDWLSLRRKLMSRMKKLK